ncbi:hypothetical protein PIB30_074045, partial [Stylosanthes scabra]|nr:hypothetical protein [Stylosanthes scabra]
MVIKHSLIPASRRTVPTLNISLSPKETVSPTHDSQPPPTPCTPPRDRRHPVLASRRLVLATLTHTLVSLPPPLTALSYVVPPVPPPSSPQGSSKFVVLSRLLPSNRRILSKSSRLVADSCSPHRRFISASSP